MKDKNYKEYWQEMSSGIDNFFNFFGGEKATANIEIEIVKREINCSKSCAFLAGDGSYCWLFSNNLTTDAGRQIRCRDCIEKFKF